MSLSIRRWLEHGLVMVIGLLFAGRSPFLFLFPRYYYKVRVRWS